MILLTTNPAQSIFSARLNMLPKDLWIVFATEDGKAGCGEIGVYHLRIKSRIMSVETSERVVLSAEEVEMSGGRFDVDAEDH